MQKGAHGAVYSSALFFFYARDNESTSARRAHRAKSSPVFPVIPIFPHFLSRCWGPPRRQGLGILGWRRE